MVELPVYKKPKNVFETEHIFFVISCDIFTVIKSTFKVFRLKFLKLTIL